MQLDTDALKVGNFWIDELDQIIGKKNSTVPISVPDWTKLLNIDDVRIYRVSIPDALIKVALLPIITGEVASIVD